MIGNQIFQGLALEKHFKQNYIKHNQIIIEPIIEQNCKTQTNSKQNQCLRTIQVGNYYAYNIDEITEEPKILISKNWICFTLSTFVTYISLFIIFETKLWNHASTNTNTVSNFQQDPLLLNIRKLQIINKLIQIPILHTSVQLHQSSASQFLLSQKNKINFILIGLGVFWLLIQTYLSISLMIINPGIAPLKQKYIEKAIYMQTQIMVQEQKTASCNICDRVVDNATYHCNQCKICFSFHQHHCNFLGKCLTNTNISLARIYLILLVFGLISNTIIYTIY